MVSSDTNLGYLLRANDKTCHFSNFKENCALTCDHIEELLLTKAQLNAIQLDVKKEDNPPETSNLNRASKISRDFLNVSLSKEQCWYAAAILLFCSVLVTFALVIVPNVNSFVSSASPKKGRVLPKVRRQRKKSRTSRGQSSDQHSRRRSAGNNGEEGDSLLGEKDSKAAATYSLHALGSASPPLPDIL